MQNVIRLPLENAYNVRELGGYYTKTKELTMWHRFLRGDDISKLSSKDIEYLINYGVSCVIDLRSQEECDQAPDAIKDIEQIQYLHVPFMKGNVGDATKLVNLENFDLGYFYVEILKDKKLITNILEVIASAKEGCILFHCSAGKDRTGVLSMLLLMIAGVSVCDMEANYQLTYTYLKEKPGLFDMIREDMDISCMYSKPESIRVAIDYILDTYGDINNYLKECNVSVKTIESIKKKLLSSL